MNIKATLEEAHKTLTIWFGYLVAASLVLQEEWATMDDYVPPKMRHIIIGTATFAVIADKIRRSVIRKDQT